MNTVVVVLNYLNYKDTIECVGSIIEMNYSLRGIIIVDNGSKNNSYNQLKNYYQEEKRVCLLRTKKNLGYAKGNNIGINYAVTNMKANNVLVVNNDTIFTESEYVERILKKVKPKVGIIDSKVIGKNGKVCPNIEAPTSVLGIIIRYLRYKLECHEFEIFKELLLKLENKYGKCVVAPQGCALLFTQEFLKNYLGFYPKTFLYCEEHILSLLLQKAGLKLEHAYDTEIYHKEDMSSRMSFNNDGIKKKKIEIESYKYVFKVKFTPKNRIMRGAKVR